MATSIDNLAQESIARNDVAAQALSKIQDSISNVTAQAVNTLEGSKDDARLVAETGRLAEAKAASQTYDFAARVGTNPDAASYALEQLVAKSNELAERQRDVSARIENAATPANFFKDPLSFIADFALLDFNQVRQKAVTDQLNSVNQQVRTLNEFTQQHRLTMNAIAQSNTIENAKAAGRLAELQIVRDIAGLELDALRMNSQGILQINQLKNSKLDIALKARDQQLQEANIAVARGNQALQAQSLALALEDRRDRMQLRKEEIASRDNTLIAVNIGRRSTGLPEFRSFDELQTFAKMDPKQAEFIAQQYSIGLTASQQGVATIAKDPYTALKYVTATGAQISDPRSKVLKFIDGIRGQISTDPKLAGTIKKESDLAGHINGRAASTATSMLNNVTAGGANNIYAPPPIDTYIQDKEFSRTYIAQQILAPLTKGGVQEVPVKTMMNLLLDSVRTGKITAQQADSELGFFAQKTMGYNNELYRYNATAGLPNMKSMNVVLDDQGPVQALVNKVAAPGTVGSLLPGGLGVYRAFGGSDETVVDIANPTKRAAYINKQLAKVIPPVLREQAAVTSKTGAQ